MKRRLRAAEKNIFRNQKHVLIGNGLSLNPKILESLKNCITYACNEFWEGECHNSFFPTFYCLGDPAYADPNLYPGDLDYFYSGLINKYPYTTILASQGIAERIIQQTSGSTTQPNILWAPFSDSYSDDHQYSLRLHEALEPFQNVLIFMLQYACYFGAREIELHGFDFTSIFLHAFVDQNSAHFYDKGIECRNGLSLRKPKDIESLVLHFNRNLVLSCQLARMRNTLKECGASLVNLSDTSLLPPLS
jgi:hypothetical protein